MVNELGASVAIGLTDGDAAGVESLERRRCGSWGEDEKRDAKLRGERRGCASAKFELGPIESVEFSTSFNSVVNGSRSNGSARATLVDMPGNDGIEITESFVAAAGAIVADAAVVVAIVDASFELLHDRIEAGDCSAVDAVVVAITSVCILAIAAEFSFASISFLSVKSQFISLTRIDGDARFASMMPLVDAEWST